MKHDEAIEALQETLKMYFEPCPDNVLHQKKALTYAIEHLKTFR